MDHCDSLASCGFFQHRVAAMPMVTDVIKQRFCLGDWTVCARRRVQDHGLPVPDDLYPEDTDRADRITAGESGLRAMDVLTDGELR